MQVKVTLTLKDEELKKIMDNSGLTKPDEIKGYFYAREKRNIECEFGNRYDIDVKVDDVSDGLRRRLDEISAQRYIYDQLFNHKDPAGKPGEPGVKEVKRYAKVGEWIKISTNENISIDPYMDGEARYQYGDIFKVYKMHPGFPGSVYCELNNKVKDTKGDLKNSYIIDNGNLEIEAYEYVVLEGYKPPKKPEVKEVKRHAKPGEWIKIITPFWTAGKYTVGDILKVKSLKDWGNKDDGVYVEEFDHPYIKGYEYVVLENYEPPKKPEVKEVKRPAKVGEYVKLTYDGLFEGRIYKVREICSKAYELKDVAYVDIDDDFSLGYTVDEYVVLENYNPEDGEKK